MSDEKENKRISEILSRISANDNAQRLIASIKNDEKKKEEKKVRKQLVDSPNPRQKIIDDMIKKEEEKGR